MERDERQALIAAVAERMPERHPFASALLRVLHQMDRDLRELENA